MEVKSYRAPTLQEALTLVRKDLGPEAAVLQTRQVWPGMLRGLMGRRQVEVTASNDVIVPSRFGFDSARMAVDAGMELDRPAITEAAVATDIPNEPISRSGSTSQEWGTWIKDGSGPQCGHRMPQSLFDLFTDLVDADVDDELARELVADLQGTVTSLDRPQDLYDVAIQRIESEIPVQGPIEASPGSGRVVALVGPTGVGKTTTIAKLAANFRLREKRRVGLITVDTYRIAAVEQLRTYADIIDLPMEVVSTAREMREAVDRLSDLDLILMDTAGRSPRDEIKIRELKSILGEAKADEVHLVLSSTAGAATLCKTAQWFSEVGTTSLLITKLDESTGLGNLLPLWRSCKLPMSYVTNGQNVPDDIQPADAGRLARAILGKN